MRDSYISANYSNMREKPSVAVHDYKSSGIWSFLKGLKISHWILLLYPIFMFIVRRQRDFDELYVIDTSAQLQIFATALFGFYAFVRFFLFLPAFKKSLVRRPLIWLLLYFILAIFSAIWSDRPDYTFYRAFEALIFLILVADAMISLGNLENMIKFQLCFGFVLIMFWQFFRFRFGFHLEGLHDSLVPGTIIATAFVGWLVRGWIWRLAHMFILLSIFLATSSATYISFIFGAGIILIFKRGKTRFLGISLVLLIAFFIKVFGLHYMDLVFWGKTEQNIVTASGRIPVWQWALEDKVTQKPVLGYSFGEGETLARLYDPGYSGFRMMHMHNVAMGALTNLGIVGLLLLTLFFLSIIISVFTFKYHPSRSIIMGASMSLMMNAFSISSITSPLSFGWIGQALFFSMIAIMATNEKAQNTISYRPPKYRIVW